MLPANRTLPETDRRRKVGLVRPDAVQKDSGRLREFEIVAKGEPEALPENAIHLHLGEIAARHPSKIAISDGASQINYSRLNADVVSWKGLIETLAPEGSAIGILQPAPARHIVAVLATIAAGCIAVPLEPGGSGEGVSHTAVAAHLTAIIGTGPRPDSLAPDIRWINMGATSAATVAVASAPASVMAPAIIHFVTEVDGRSTGIVNSQQSLLGRVHHQIDACKITAADVILSLSARSSFTFCIDMLAAILSGATLQTIDDFGGGPEGVRARVQRSTIAGFSPALLDVVLGNAPQGAFHCLRIARIFGSPPTSEVAALRTVLGATCRIQIGYSWAGAPGPQWFAQQESADASSPPPLDLALADTSFRIRRKDGSNAATGETGELVVVSAYACLGRWENGGLVPVDPNPDNADERVWATGVLAQLTDDGLFRLVDRTVADATPIGPTAKATSAAPKAVTPTLFLFPGSVGYGPSLAALNASLAKTAKIVPIRYPNLAQILNGEADLASMVDAAVKQIGGAQPEGDLRFLGHSLGGAVAVETAARFLDQGRLVKFLGILDTSLEPEPKSGHLRETFARSVRRIRENPVSIQRLGLRALAKVTVRIGREAQAVRAMDAYTKGQFNSSCFRLKQELQEVLRAKAFYGWLAAPRIQLPIPATLFRCARPGMSPTIGWDRVFTDLEVIPVAGTHVELVVEPYIATNRPLIERAVVQTYSAVELTRLGGQPA